jgi:hypothetical protein
VRSKRARALLQSRLTTRHRADDATCRPWSRAILLSRVESYSPIKWFSKPASLSPLLCARFGWICSAVDCLAVRHLSRRGAAPPMRRSLRTSPISVVLRIAPTVRGQRSPRRAIRRRAARCRRHARQYRAALARLFALRRVPLLSPDAIARELAVLHALPLYDNLDCTDAAKSDTLRCLAVHGWDAERRRRVGALRAVSALGARRRLVAIDDILADLPAERREAPFFDVTSEHRTFCPWSRAAAHSEMLRAFGARGANRRSQQIYQPSTTST